ncbi:MAG: potassium/proton antiporter [Candidatus Rokubacteria bacterium]|nr:potassium/proton antiporter [Candidatus Rokubacteria bacterium]
MAPPESLLLVASVLLLVSIIASKSTGRLGVPALLLFLVIGMLAGSEGPGGIAFDDPGLAQALGVLALALILFAGGADTDWRSVRPVVWEALALSTLGVFITAVTLAALLHLLLQYSFREALLLGAIVSSTDAAAVFAVLRSRNVGLRGRLKPLLELESGSNDPMAVFLTVAAIRVLMEPAVPAGSIALAFVLQMSVGAAAGYGIGKGMVWFANRVRLEYEGLYPVLILALVLFTYGATATIGGNGFLAVYLAGIVMGNSDFIHKRSVVRFHDGLAWLMQIVMFLALGLLVFPSRLVTVIVPGLITAAVLMFVARPVGVLLVLFPSKMPRAAKAMVAWVGLRGAVPIVLATFPLLAGVPGADRLFDLVFFVVLTSVLLQGTSIPAVARWLGLDVAAERPLVPSDVSAVATAGALLTEIRVPPGSATAGKRVLDLGLPRGALMVLLKRGDHVIIPDGGTEIEEGDVVVVLADERAHEAIKALVEGGGGRADRPRGAC